MTPAAMSHDEAAELLEAAALDTLPADEQERVLAHAATCSICGPELARLRDAVALLAFAVPAVPGDPARLERVRTRLLARARGDVAVAESPSHGVSGSHDDGGQGVAAPAVVRGGAPRDSTGVGRGRQRAGTMAVVGWALAAAATIAAIVVIGRDRARFTHQLLVERHEASAAVDSMRSLLDARDRMLAQLTGPQVAVVELTASGARAPSARMFWDRATNGWTFVAHDLPAPPAGRTYQLWLVTPASKVSAGTFAPAPNGDALVRATYALPADSLRAVAVTEEPAGGSPQPTGPLVIAGTPGNRPGK